MVQTSTGLFLWNAARYEAFFARPRRKSPAKTNNHFGMRLLHATRAIRMRSAPLIEIFSLIDQRKDLSKENRFARAIILTHVPVIPLGAPA